MINSMTGFGGASAEVDGIVYAVEIRTVNNRYLKCHLKLAEFDAFLSDDIEKLLRKNICRGTVNYILNAGNVSGRELFKVNEGTVREYMTKLTEIAGASNIEYQINLADLLALPGALESSTPDAEEAKGIKAAVLELTCQAIESLKKMRAEEGAALAAELIGYCESITKTLELVRQQSQLVVKQYYDKLKKRAEELLTQTQLKIDEETLARETAIFADRSDISEELARLDSHLAQFVSVCRENESAGRKLDFISQEMLREANTIASKAYNTEISRWIIEIKCSIDKIKEQVQNIE